MAPNSRSPHPAESQASLAHFPAGETTLQPTCIVPWDSAFESGSGVDALTGHVMSRALKCFDITDSRSSARIDAYISVCESTNSAQETFSRTSSASNSLHCDPLELRNSLMSGALSHVEQSSTSFSLLARWQSIENLATLVEPKAGYQLEPRAEEVLTQEGVGRFRALYGDYFVAKAARGARFDAVLSFRYGTAQQRQEALKTLEAGGSVTSAKLPATGSVDLRHSLAGISGAFTQSARVTMTVSMDGVCLDTGKTGSHAQQPPAGQYLDLKDATPVLMCFEWFMAHLQPTIMLAQLRAYRLIAGAAVSIPDTIPVHPEVYSEVNRIRQSIVACTATSTIVGNVNAATLALQLKELGHAYTSHGRALATNHPERKRLFQDAAKLTADYTRLYAAWSLWNGLRASKAAEPPSRDYIKATSVGQQWSSGWTEAVAFPIAITQKILQPVHSHKTVLHSRGALAHVRAVYAVAGQELVDIETRHHAVCEDHPTQSAGERVVGWSVTSLDRHGEWRIEAGGLGSRVGDQFRISLSSGRFRSVGWQVAVYVVRDDFFDLVVQTVH